MGCNKKNVQLGAASSQMQAWTSGWPVTWKSEKTRKSQGGKWVREKSGKSQGISSFFFKIQGESLFLVT